MGREIDRHEFADAEYERFAARLRDSLTALERVLGRPGFGEGPPTLGAELELSLVDDGGRPLPCNRAVLEDAGHPLLTLETDRFDLECTTSPVPLAGRPFAALGDELSATLAAARVAAARHGARIATIGILPTLREADLQAGALTESARYRALSAGLRRLRRAPFEVAIAGEDELRIACDDVTFEGATTSWQVHLKVPPSAFVATYNAAQIAIAPVLAAAVNSPCFLGRRLWDETRIALFRQAVDERVDADADDWRPARVSFGHGWARRGAFELFAESVALHPPVIPILADEDPLAAARAGVPALAELRLHQGTVWHWTRPVYDAGGGGHVRIEMRALPSGPTMADMLANGAFLVGLTLALGPESERLVSRLTFGQARRSFYQAARRGLDAEILWPTDEPPSPRPVAAHALVPRLLPLARDALVDLHNNTGHNPAYGVGAAADAARLNLTALFAERYVVSELRLGTLCEATAQDFPSVTIECGRAGDPAADETARAGLERYLTAFEIETRAVLATRMTVLEDPVRVSVVPGVRLAFAERPLAGVDLTLAPDLDRHNFETVLPGAPLGWLAPGAAWPLEARAADGEEVSRDLFVVRDGRVETRRGMVPIMMTTDAALVLADCLFYAVRVREEIGRG
ncbi:MAG: glutamate--cysteine ligase [Thermodesulfobacteriota bacterium]